MKSTPSSPQVKPKSYLLGKSDNFFLVHNEIAKQRKKIIKYENKMEVCLLELAFIVIYIQEKEKREYFEKVFEVPRDSWVAIVTSLSNLKEISR